MTCTVSSVILAKQNLNHLGSLQWQEQIDETFNLIPFNIIFHNLISSSWFGYCRRRLRSTQQNKLSLLFWQLMPSTRSANTNILCLFCNLSLFSAKYFLTNSMSDRIEEIRCCVCEETNEKLGILLATVTTLSF